MAFISPKIVHFCPLSQGGRAKGLSGLSTIKEHFFFAAFPSQTNLFSKLYWALNIFDILSCLKDFLLNPTIDIK